MRDPEVWTDQEWEEHSYRELADELSAETWGDGIPITLADFQPRFVEEARLASVRLDLPWPPVPCVDTAIDLIERAKSGER